MTNDQLTDRSDLDGWVQAAASDRNAFGRLFDLFYPQVFAYCMRRMLVRAVAEDVASEVFLKVASAIGRFQGSNAEDFRRWLFRITTNEINAQLRKSIRQQALLESALSLGMVGKQVSSQALHTDLEVDWGQIYRAIGELSEREQSIVSLRFLGGQTHEEIAKILEIKQGAARVALKRALDKLRNKLRGHHHRSLSNPLSTNSTHTTGREETS